MFNFSILYLSPFGIFLSFEKHHTSQSMHYTWYHFGNLKLTGATLNCFPNFGGFFALFVDIRYNTEYIFGKLKIWVAQ